MRIEQIGTPPGLPGIRRLEWHAAPHPDGRFLRLPIPDVILTINLGVIGQYRLTREADWAPFPPIAVRGICSAPSAGIDPPHGALSYLSVVIAPWALRSYTGIEPVHAANAILDAVTLCPALADLDRALRLIEHPSQRLDLAARWLLQHHRPSPDTCVPTVVDALRDDIAVADIARTCRISTRHVHHLCLRETGVNPSTYRQIARFARLAQALHDTAQTQSWTQSLSEYADHSHAIRTFRRMAQVTPRAYQGSRRSAPRAYSIVPSDTGTPAPPSVTPADRPQTAAPADAA